MPNTPKKYKGFSKLPEAVQQKMDPKAAMKYMEGGAVGMENVKPKAKPAQPGSKRPPKRPNAMDGRRKGDIKTEELLAGMTKAEINAAINSGKNPKKKSPLKATVSPSKSTGALAEFVKDAAKYGVLGGSAATAGRAAKKVLGMKYGGEARVREMSRGGGAAVSGTKFTGCK